MKTRTILIMMASGYGHLNPTFELATRLQGQGFRIVYAVPATFSSLVQENGFSTVECNPHVFKFGSDDRAVDKKYEVKNIFHRMVDRITNLHIHNVKEATVKMNQAIAKVQPDILLLDSLIAYNYFLLADSKLPVMLLQTMLGSPLRLGVPPLSSGLLPDVNGEFSSLKVQISWMKYQLSRRIKIMLSMGDNQLGIISRVIGRSLSTEVFSNNAFRPGIKGLKEIVIAPKALDYNEITPVTQLYLASTVYQKRTENIVNNQMRQLIYDLVHAGKEKTWVYCSLGTLNQSHNKYCETFFARMVELFTQKPEWQLIMSTGEVPVNKYKVSTNNIHLFQRVPQLKVLEHCNIAIIHGGLNSVLECIHFAKPMLVYPLTDTWDQSGNAARVVHYGMGLRGKLEQATTAGIGAKLEKLLTNSIYSEAVGQMQMTIQAEKNDVWRSGQLEEMMHDLWRDSGENHQAEAEKYQYLEM